MRIVLAGGSGFLGTQLTRCLVDGGDQVVRLVRRPPRGTDEQQWDPRAGMLDPALFAGVDAVVNLAGAPVARPWTGHGRRLIASSRVETTTTLARAVAAAPDRPAVLLNASAVGYYGDRGDLAVDERAAAGDGFLPGVCQVWEAATRPAEDAGVRVVRLRTGLVLGPGGGLLGPVLPVFRLGLGSRLGSGRQYWPWIALVDWLAAVRFLLTHEEITGPVNVVGPEPATNAEFTTALGRVLRRPTALAVPGPAIRLAVGGFACELLDSRRVYPRVLQEAGFEFTHRDVRSALRAAVDGATG